MIGDCRSVGRPSVIEPFRAQLAALLEAHPRMRTIEVLRRMREAGYAGGKSALYEMARSLRRRDSSPLAVFESVPGVLSQHDLGAVVVIYTTGRKERVCIFASRLSYSSYLDVRLVRNDRIDSLIGSLLAAFETFGGVPLVAMFHNPRIVTVARDGQRIEWDETLGQVAIDYRIALELGARDGGKECAGDLVGFVKQSFFKTRTFRSHDHLLEQLAGWQREINTMRPCRATGVTPVSRLGEERQRLRPLAIPRAEYSQRISVAVGRRRPRIDRLEIFDPRAISEALRAHRPEFPETDQPVSGKRLSIVTPPRAAID